MKKRLLSALIFLPPVFYAVTVGGWLFISLIGLVTVIAFYEFYKTFDINNPAVFILTMLEVIVMFLIVLTNLTPFPMYFVFVFFVLLMMFYVLQYPRIELNTLDMTFVAQIYILIPLFIYALFGNYNAEGGIYLRWLVLVFSFGADTMAMFSGKLFGKKKLIPKVSPGKTIAGCVGSVIGTGIILPLFTYVFSLFVDNIVDEFNVKSILLLFVVGAIASLFSQLGDLVGSAFKRQAGIKDFGNVIPGHGGILDRLDSIIFTSVYVYLLYKLPLFYILFD